MALQATRVRRRRPKSNFSAKLAKFHSLRIPFVSPKPFFSEEENHRVVQAIQHAEKRTSGEIRVYVESRCRFVDPLDRAAEVFHSLKMGETKERNAVLVYLAVKDRQLAVFGDKAVHEKVGGDFWHDKVHVMIAHFQKKNYAEGLVRIIGEIGEALRLHFPYDEKSDRNELPDDIVFGR